MENNKIYKFRNRIFTKEDIKKIQNIINKNYNKGRMKIAEIVAKKLDWKTFSGHLKIIGCKDALKRMANKGLIKLPPSKLIISIKPKIKKIKYKELKYKFKRIPLIGKIDDFKELKFKKVENKEDKKLFRYLLQKYHYLGYRIIVGRHINYLIYLDNNLVGVISFADAILHHNLRDKYIGWDIETRMKKLHLIINNVRFLILPWIHIQNLGSKILSIASKTVPKDWKLKYGYEPILFETFVDCKKFLGTVYKASNWKYLGRTKGKCRKGLYWFAHRRPKDLYIFPLKKEAIKILNEKMSLY